MAIICVRAAFAATLLLGVAGYAGRTHRLLELASHFKLQFLLASLAFFLIFSVLGHKAWMCAAALCFVLNFIAIAPWYVGEGAKSEVDEPKLSVRLMLSNVLYAKSQLQFVRLVCARAKSGHTCLPGSVVSLGRELEVLKADYPHAVVVPRSGGSGLALYSRWPLSESFILHLGDASRPSILAGVDFSGTIINVLTLHPETPIAPADFRARNTQLAAAAELAQKIPGHKVVLGDLNTTLFLTFSGRPGRSLRHDQRASRCGASPQLANASSAAAQNSS
ncbi:MAG: endonuclease/exonuclease/phosphatase family protein [Pyrinomonadaceae bacterium]